MYLLVCILSSLVLHRDPGLSTVIYDFPCSITTNILHYHVYNGQLESYVLRPYSYLVQNYISSQEIASSLV